MSEPVLSICIASYNHGYSLHDKIKTLLAQEYDDFQVVVSDNCSTDDTQNLLGSISDSRLKVVHLRENEGPVKNYISALNNADGKYAMFLTDKDTLITSQLGLVLSIFRSVDYATGYFELDCQPQEGYSVVEYADRRSSLLNIAYLSKHPTGYFFNRRLMLQTDISENFIDTKKVGYFPFEFICAELCMQGVTAVIRTPFCTTSKIQPNTNSQSATYSLEKKNLFFLPEQRFEMLAKYISHLNRLPLTQGERAAMLRKLLFTTYIQSTILYKMILEDSAKCTHYRIPSKKVTNRELREITELFNAYVRANLPFRSSSERTYSLVILTAFERYFFAKQSLKAFLKGKNDKKII